MIFWLFMMLLFCTTNTLFNKVINVFISCKLKQDTSHHLIYVNLLHSCPQNSEITCKYNNTQHLVIVHNQQNCFIYYWEGGQNIVRGVKISLRYIDPGVKISYDILTPGSIYRGVKISSHTGRQRRLLEPALWLRNDLSIPRAPENMSHKIS